MIHSVFCRCFKSRSLYANVYTMNHSDTFFFGNFVSQSSQLSVIGLVHVRESWTCWEVLTMKWMLREEVDMIVDDHQISNFKVGIHSSRGIGNKQSFNAQLVHDALWEGYFFHVITFIIVESALHSHDVLATQLAKNKLARMTFHRGQGEVWNVSIGEFVTICYL